MTHHLKILPEYFQGVINGKKPFEIRYNDRDFKKGDRVILEEYTGKELIPLCENRDKREIDPIDNFTYYCELFEFGDCQRNGKCGEYIKHNYTGQRCLIRIKDIFNLDNAGEDFKGYVAFTFEILAIKGKKVNAVDDKLERFVKRIKEETGDGMFGLENSTIDEILKENKG